MIHVADPTTCCGCSACVQRCPRECIDMIEDAEGFSYPRVDESRCVECGLCERVCPLLNRAEPREPMQVLAVKNTNESERLASSSGGVFIELAKLVLSTGGVVFGAVFDEHWQVVITYSDTLEGVRPMMGSKYVQASMGTAYRDAERFLKAGRQVLFTGTPCQIAGLHGFLRKEYTNLLCVDVLCHGVPSPGVWRKYVSELKEKEAARRAARGGRNSVFQSLNQMPLIEGIRFRDKTLGWAKYSFSVAYLAEASGRRQGNTVFRSHVFSKDPYMRGFLADVYLRPSCYGCASKGGRSHSDLTIADFWGIERLMPDFNDDKGVGLVLVNTPAGQEAFNALPMEVRSSTYADALATNGGFNEHLRPHCRRADFYKRFQRGGKTLEQILDIIMRPTLSRRVKNKTKTLLRRVLGPKGVEVLKRIVRR